MDSVIPLRKPATPRPAPTAADPAWLASLLLLHDRLLGCDTVTPVLERFLAWLRHEGLGDGLGVQLPGEAGERQLGDSRRHRCTYRLQLEGEPLGEITAMRARRYAEEELARVEQALGAIAKALRLARSRESLERRATRDALTGLLNRDALDDGLRREFARARRQGSALSLLLIDVDNFKALNDRLGHLGGDHALRAIADSLRASVRETDLIYRQGGDEFAVLMPDTPLAAAQLAAARIRANVGVLPAPGSGGSAPAPRPDVSIGAAEHRAGESQEGLLRRADKALYDAKAGGRGRVEVAS